MLPTFEHVFIILTCASASETPLESPTSDTTTSGVSARTNQSTCMSDMLCHHCLPLGPPHRSHTVSACLLCVQTLLLKPWQDTPHTCLSRFFCEPHQTAQAHVRSAERVGYGATRRLSATGASCDDISPYEWMFMFIPTYAFAPLSLLPYPPRPYSPC